MKPRVREPTGSVVTTALAGRCADCGSKPQISQFRERYVQRLDGYLHVVRRDKRCLARRCPGKRPIVHAPEDLRLALPCRTYGLDVTLFVGDSHLRLGRSLGAIGRDLVDRGVPISQRNVGRLLRDFVAITNVARGDDDALRAKLRAQGGIVLMADGVPFEDRSPVLYLAWDALSATALFGERKAFRSEEDLVPILERVKAMDVPVIGIVSDKEKGLVPAIAAVFPGVPYQLCHTHFLKNCAKPLEPDLARLGASVAQRAERVRRVAKRLHEEVSRPREETHDSTAPVQTEHVGDADEDSLPRAPEHGSLTERELAGELCSLVRQNSRASGKPPLDPPELRRHERLETVRELAEEARKKGRRRLAVHSMRSPRR